MAIDGIESERHTLVAVEGERQDRRRREVRAVGAPKKAKPKKQKPLPPANYIAQADRLSQPVFPQTVREVFEVEAFRSASIDALWLSAEVAAADAEPLASELRRMGARQVSIVPEAVPEARR